MFRTDRVALLPYIEADVIMAQKSFPQFPVLIVDDEEDVLQSYRMTLRLSGINNFVLCSDSRRVMDLLASSQHCVVILDLAMPHVSGRELLNSVREKHPEIPIIVVTASNNVATAVECMKLGALDYMVKPVEDSRLVSGLKIAIELNELRDENAALKQRLLVQPIKTGEVFSSIITTSDSLYSIFSYIEAIASSTKPVLITGESGTGKELFARAIHTVSGRAGKFVPVNVAGLDDTVFSDTLFGHRKGAFTGADAERRGLVEEASGGTLFLDEIGSLDGASQIKLLRLLQEHEYYPLGSDLQKTARISVVAATNEDLQKKMKEGLFRNDLYFRLLTHHIHIPPLRKRREDIPALIDHFLEQASHASGKPKPAVTPDLLGLFEHYDFPGNVRELGALIYDLVTRNTTSTLDIDQAREYISLETGKSLEEVSVGDQKCCMIPYRGEFPKLREVEDFLICEAIKTSAGNQCRAAELLGVAQSTLWRRLKK
jgi:DNA-binding NtrC family response regulator